ncbi:MAG TPA: ATP-binding cassette domain-containing protein [Ignavibacteriaceae bacterium]|nr:ATP-binding cassette domain-containing protein [Ignavibacteriaceae bacterium]
MLEIRNLVKEYKNVTAVNDISFNIEPGKIFGLLGPNGAGKTTTIRTILNIIKPTSGLITLDGNSITEDFYNLIGYLPEDRGLYKKSKVIDVILYFSSLKSIDKKEALKRVSYWLSELNIEEYKYKKIEELSKGNQQKIQFITAVLHDPKILILDEPFSGFDPINQQLIKEQILNFASSGKIIVLSTHQMDTAEKLCSDILLLNNGKEVCKGNLAKIKKEFGTNNIKIEFDGDASFLNELDDVKSIDVYSTYAEIHLVQNIKPAEFLRKISDRLLISHFSVIEPTLNTIFLDVIKSTK